MNRKCGPKKNNRAIKFMTARPNGVLRGSVGSRHAKTLNKYTEPTPPLKIYSGTLPGVAKRVTSPAPHSINNFCYRVIN